MLVDLDSKDEFCPNAIRRLDIGEVVFTLSVGLRLDTVISLRWDISSDSELE